MIAYNNLKLLCSKIAYFISFFILVNSNSIQLSEYEKAQTITCRKCGISEREISRKMNRSFDYFLIIWKINKDEGTMNQ